MILVDDYPQLSFLAWNRKVRTISEDEARSLYEAHPQWVDRATMGDHERALLDQLAPPTETPSIARSHGRSVGCEIVPTCSSARS